MPIEITADDAVDVSMVEVRTSLKDLKAQRERKRNTLKPVQAQLDILKITKDRLNAEIATLNAKIDILQTAKDAV